MSSTRYPPVDRRPQYPLNDVTVTEGGHEFHIDNTPGAERLLVSHRSGTHVEIGADGALHVFSVGNSYQYHKSGMTITVAQNGDIKIGGHAAIQVEGGALLKVEGNVDLAVGGDVTADIKGKLTAEVGGNASVKAGGTVAVQSGGAMSIKGASVSIDGSPVKINGIVQVGS